MKISLSNISKKYNRQFILKNYSQDFESNTSYAITGANGKGKSTLLKIASGFLSPDKGEVYYFDDKIKIASLDMPTHIVFHAPYITINPYLTLSEWFSFYTTFKKVVDEQNAFFSAIEIDPNKRYNELSSGMQQRFRLYLTFCTEAKIILLDEPCSFLDKKWKEEYQVWLNTKVGVKTLLISSNDPFEYEGVKNVIQL
jgi:ABC-type multidrug transport system ATPase subunit